MQPPSQEIWDIDKFSESAHAALRKLSEGADAQETFAALLESDSIAARGYAVEIYVLLDSDTRWGNEHPLAALAGRVHDCAVQLLEAPPLAEGVFGALVPHANHASALRAMWTLATPDDAAAITRGLRTAATPLTQTRAACAALFWLQRWSQSHLAPRELREAAREIVRNPEAAVAARCACMRCLTFDREKESETALLEASRESDLQVATNAAFVLAHLDIEKYRGHLEALVETWGEEPPYLGDEVREKLGIS